MTPTAEMEAKPEINRKQIRVTIADREAARFVNVEKWKQIAAYHVEDFESGGATEENLERWFLPALTEKAFDDAHWGRMKRKEIIIRTIEATRIVYGGELQQIRVLVTGMGAEQRGMNHGQLSAEQMPRIAIMVSSVPERVLHGKIKVQLASVSADLASCLEAIQDCRKLARGAHRQQDDRMVASVRSAMTAASRAEKELMSA